MALTTGQRDEVAKVLNRIIAGNESCAFIKSILRTAVDNVDDWADTNATSFNNTLNATFRANATSTQKAVVLAVVCWYRAGRTFPEGQ